MLIKSCRFSYCCPPFSALSSSKNALSSAESELNLFWAVVIASCAFALNSSFVNVEAANLTQFSAISPFLMCFIFHL
ncbi:hypothetical protein NWE61_03235 [Mycoplasmopsis felis]|uniref:hypothetical protein n=1 Tax=Mycoplasmopsis felis TaxID=33923 RepID=UPI0021DF5D7C|nr:hypothetical protein [Mycoplasmopsis felis]MCU9934171.1 hypothetical protein [Mycoplasmopsis felis]